MAYQTFSVAIGGKEKKNFLAPRIPGVGEYLSVFDDKGVQEFYKVTRVLWTRSDDSVIFEATVCVVEAQP
jgi:hypothetical protein